MAFPSIDGRNGGFNNVAGQNHAVNLAGGIAAGKLLIVIFTSQGNPTIGFPVGWDLLFSAVNGTSMKMVAYKRTADGTEDATINVTTDDNRQTSHKSYTISNYFSAPVVGTAVAATTEFPDPPNVNPAWVPQDTLWIALVGWTNNTRTVDNYPSNYSDGSKYGTGGDANSTATASAERELSADSENPGTFDISSTVISVANTIAIEGLQPVPSPPTDVDATDGLHTNKVVISWTQDPDAVDYQVYRDGAGLGWLGDVATYDDTGADPPTITPGTAVASDGLYSAYVALSLSGTSANNGTTHTYKVVCRNANGVESGDSATDNGYIGVGSLTYQWQRSFSDADELYSNIIGAETSAYDDYDAPERGWGRYYKCILNAAGAVQQTSASNRGFRQAPYVPLLGKTRIDAKSYMAQLADETVFEYSATDKAANTIISELLAFQHNTPPITIGTIEYSTFLSIEVPQDSILGVLTRLREMLGGYMSVNDDRELDWLTDIGENLGQQIRYHKNLKGIRRTIDYSNFANRIYAYGAGEGEDRIKLSSQICQSELIPGTDIAGKRWYGEAWTFILSPEYWIVGSEYYYGGIFTGKWGCGGRFLNIPITFGDTIKHAYLKFPGGQFTQTVVKSKIRAENADNPITFSTLADYDARPRTATAVMWDNIPPYLGDGVSPDIASVIQVIANRPGRVANNPIVIFWDDHDGRSEAKRYHMRRGLLPPILYIEYYSTAKDYIEDIISQAQYGGIYTQRLINKAITDSDTLGEWASLKLLEMKDPYISYEIDIVNLEAAGFEFENLQLGNIIRVIDEDLDINVMARIVKITRDLSNPLKVKVEIANKVRDVIEQLGRDFRWENVHY